MTNRTYELRVRLDDDIHTRLDSFARSTRRNTTQSVNLLLGAALAMVETQTNADALFVQAPQPGEHSERN